MTEGTTRFLTAAAASAVTGVVVWQVRDAMWKARLEVAKERISKTLSENIGTIVGSCMRVERIKRSTNLSDDAKAAMVKEETEFMRIAIRESF